MNAIKTHRLWLFLAFALAAQIGPVLAQLPENQFYKDLDVVYLNKKMREVQAQGLIFGWSLSDDRNVLTIEAGDPWDFLPREKQGELTRRLLSLFSYYIQNRDERGWNFSVVLIRGGTKLAEDRGTWMRDGKGPRVFP